MVRSWPQNHGMNFVRTLIRLATLLVAALVGLGLFLMSLCVLAALLLVSLLTGRKPDLRVVRRPQPWGRRPPAGDVVDVQAREVTDELANPAPAPAPSLQPPRQSP